jgi:hypothetical protein
MCSTQTQNGESLFLFFVIVFYTLSLSLLHPHLSSALLHWQGAADYLSVCLSVCRAAYSDYHILVQDKKQFLRGGEVCPLLYDEYSLYLTSSSSDPGGSYHSVTPSEMLGNR